MSTPAERSDWDRRLPLVGRARDLTGLATLYGDPSRVEPCCLLTGETGVGKSRLAEAFRQEATRRGWKVVAGRAYPVETGVPYAVFSDAFLPLLSNMESGTIEVLTRGGQRELQRLFPPLGDAPEEAEVGSDPGELRTRLFWNFSELVKRLATREPLLILLEDLHWAAPSTLALLHFLVRQLQDENVRVLGTYNTDFREGNHRLIDLEQSLLSLRKARVHLLRPLTEEDTRELVRTTFGARGAAVDTFSTVLYGWTKGNPYFIEQTLDQLVESGRLYRREGTWLGWGTERLELAPTVRDAVLSRLSGGGEEVLSLAETLAVAGGRCRVSVLAEASGLDDAAHDATEALLGLGLVEETEATGRDVALEFRHPLVREALYQRLSLTRRGRLHQVLGETLERGYGDEAPAHADELAYHFSRAGGGRADARAVPYLMAAGRAALNRHADREAATYLEDALVRTHADDGRTLDAGDARELRAGLARAFARLGRYDEARKLWEGLLAEAHGDHDTLGAAEAHRHLALFAFWSGDPTAALEHHRHAVDAVAARHPAIEARLHLAAGVALQELGRPIEARERLERALPLAQSSGDESTLARIHWALALLKTWVGESSGAREDAWEAITLARRTGDQLALFRARWILAVLEGLTGDTASMRELVDSARTDAEDLASPVLRLWVTELVVKYAWATGDWDRGIAEGEAAIALGRSLNQRIILSRLMVWTGVIYAGRGDLERAETLFGEAWTLSGADRVGEDAVDVHAVVPAHIGRTSLALASGRYDEAIRYGEAGLAVADGSGYVAWVLDLMPLLMEAYIRAARFEDAAAGADRMREEADRMGHPLARAWATACDALVAWQAGTGNAVALLEDAAAGLEEIPILYEATRIRRQLAGRLADEDQRDRALAELRRAHEAFEAMGATPELHKTREMYRELNSRPPIPVPPRANTTVTGREMEVAELVAGRLSNKAIARQLGIKERTVTTHLSNIYRKLGIGGRDELTDMVREGRLPLS